MKPIKEYLTFSASDRNGMIIIILILWTIVLLPRYWPEKELSKDASARFLEIADSLQRNRQQLASSGNKYQKPSEGQDWKEPKEPAKLFPFDPNDLDYDQAVALGIRTRVARTIEKYLNKGGQFRKAKDLQKIYGMDEDTYARLEPYIRIESSSNTLASQEISQAEAKESPPKSIGGLVERKPAPVQEQNEDKKSRGKDKPKKEKTAKKRKMPWIKKPIDINNADTAQWRKIRGIGSVLASRIVKYRDLLGGFVRKDQIAEVYGVEAQLAQEIDEVLFKDSSFKPRQININTAEFGQLLKHPYVAYEDAQKIVNLRSKGGDFGNIDEIKYSNAMDHGKFEKLRPYLTVE